MSSPASGRYGAPDAARTGRSNGRNGGRTTDWHHSTLEDDRAGAGDAYGLPECSGGRIWRDEPHGRVCADCGRRWAEVVGATEDAIGAKHNDALLGAAVLAHALDEVRGRCNR